MTTFLMMLYALVALSSAQLLRGFFAERSEAVDEFTRMERFISARQDLPHVRLTKDLLSVERYNQNLRPTINHSSVLQIHISISLYQLVEVNEPAQDLKLNVWMIQEWTDELLGWDPHQYGMINSTHLPHNSIWIPDTVVYNSVVMSRDDTERYTNVRLKTRYWESMPGANISFLFPAIYSFTCRLNIRYFPYDQQNCTLILGSWTNSLKSLDYTADDSVSMQSYMPNEEWDILSFKLYRREHLYACCAEAWVNIEANLIIRRRPLYYVVNLIIPSIFITLVAIVGFFTPASTSDERSEKITMGITTLLAMSILMLMVSDEMPTTSDFVPLIAWFYLSVIIIIAVGVFFTGIVLCIHGRHKYGVLPPELIRILFFINICDLMHIAPPPELTKFWHENQDTIAVQIMRKRKKYLISQMPSGTKKDSFMKRKLSTLKESVVIESQLESTDKGLLVCNDDKALTRQKSTNAKQNWARVSFRLHDISEQKDVASDVKKPKQTKSMKKISLGNRSDEKEMSLWSSAAEFVKFSTNNRSKKGESEYVRSMKYRRQCTLEWEFLAIVIDRVLLLVFIFILAIVTLGLVVVGKMASM